MIKKPEEIKKAITPEIIQATRLLFEAMAYTQTIKPIVEKYQQEILDKYSFRMSAKMADRHGGEIIKKHSESYMMEESDFKIYLHLLSKAHKENGFTVEKDCCPLLVAEHMERKAWWALAELMEPITGINCKDLYSLKHIKKYKDLTLKMIVNHLKNIGEKI